MNDYSYFQLVHSSGNPSNSNLEVIGIHLYESFFDEVSKCRGGLDAGSLRVYEDSTSCLTWR